MKILFYLVSFWAQERTPNELIPPGRAVKGKSCPALNNKTGEISQGYAQADCQLQTT